MDEDSDQISILVNERAKLNNLIKQISKSKEKSQMVEAQGNEG